MDENALNDIGYSLNEILWRDFSAAGRERASNYTSEVLELAHRLIPLRAFLPFNDYPKPVRENQDAEDKKDDRSHYVLGIFFHQDELVSNFCSKDLPQWENPIGGTDNVEIETDNFLQVLVSHCMFGTVEIDRADQVNFYCAVSTWAACVEKHKRRKTLEPLAKLFFEYRLSHLPLTDVTRLAYHYPNALAELAKRGEAPPTDLAEMSDTDWRVQAALLVPVTSFAIDAERIKRAIRRGVNRHHFMIAAIYYRYYKLQTRIVNPDNPFGELISFAEYCPLPDSYVKELQNHDIDLTKCGLCTKEQSLLLKLPLDWLTFGLKCFLGRSE